MHLLILLQLEVVGDIANAVWQLSESVRRQSHWDYGYMLQVQCELVVHENKTNLESFMPHQFCVLNPIGNESYIFEELY